MSDTDIHEPKVRLNDRFRPPDVTGAPAVSRVGSVPAPARGVAIDVRGTTALARVIEIDRLYEAVPGTTSQLLRALELLKEASDHLAAAQKSVDPIETDLSVQRAQVLLPKLFACRSVGDGFGVVINALYFAFANLRGTPLTSDQLNVVWRVLKELRARPVMSLEQGIQRVEELEARGLDVDPPHIGDLLEDPSSAEA